MKKRLFVSMLAVIPAVLSPLAVCQIVLDKAPVERPEHVYKWSVYAGYGYISLNQVDQSRYGLEGVDVSVTRDFGRYFAVTAEGTDYFKALESGNPVNAKEEVILAGPEFHVDLFTHLSGFVHGLVGGSHIHATASEIRPRGRPRSRSTFPSTPTSRLRVVLEADCNTA